MNRDIRLNHELEMQIKELQQREERVLADDIAAQKKAEVALKDSEERFRILFNQAPLGYQSLDEEGRLIEVNTAWTETLGYRREEVIGRWFGDFLAPEFIDAFRKRFPIFKSDGKIHSEFEMIHKNGERRFIAFIGRIGYQPDGTFKQTHCILSDITVQRQNQELLKQKYAELARFNAVAVGRELRMIELKLEVNELCMRLGEPPRHKIAAVPHASGALSGEPQ